MLGLFYDPAVPDAFWAKLDWSAKADGCWLWAPSAPNEYPSYPRFKGKGAARYLYQIQVRKLGPGEGVGPGCLHLSCVNPDHMKVFRSEKTVQGFAYRDRVRTEVN